MIREIAEATGIYRNGRWDILRIALVGVPLLLFVLWRLSSHGVYGADEVLHAIERDLLADYKTEPYKGVEVRISNVSMSGPLFSWSANDPIGVRFDYAIEQDGVIKAQERNVYRCTHRQTRTAVWKCNALSYYLKYL